MGFLVGEVERGGEGKGGKGARRDKRRGFFLRWREIIHTGWIGVTDERGRGHTLHDPTKSILPSTTLLPLQPPRNLPIPPPLPHLHLRIPPPFPSPRLGPDHWSPPPAPGRHHDDSFPGLHAGGVLAAEIDRRRRRLSVLVVGRGFASFARVAHPEVQPAGGVFTACEAVGVVGASFAEDADLYGDSELDVADDAVAAGVLALAAAAVP